MNMKINASVLGVALLFGSTIARADHQAATGHSFVGKGKVNSTDTTGFSVTSSGEGYTGYGPDYVYNNDSVSQWDPPRLYEASLGWTTYAVSQAATWTVYFYGNGQNTSCTIFATNVATGVQVLPAGTFTAAPFGYTFRGISMSIPPGTYAFNIECALPPIWSGTPTKIYFVN